MITVLDLIIAGVIGILFGVGINRDLWRANAHHPWRIESGGKLYKVVELGDAESEEMAEDLFARNQADE